MSLMIPNRNQAAGICIFAIAILAPFAASSQEGITCGLVETHDGPEFWGACPNAPPPAPPKPDVWGAIAVSPNLTLPGYSYNYPDEQAARQAALENCAGQGGNDCRIVVTVADLCAAVAMSKPEKIVTPNGPIGAANYASSGAMLNCRRAGGRSCVVTTSFCADGINHVTNADTVFSNGNPIAVSPGQAGPGFGRRP
jgi:hypothetical protein